MKILQFIIAVACGLCSLNTVAEQAAELERLVQQWLNIEKQTSSLAANWAEQKSSMLQHLQLMEQEKQQLAHIADKSAQSGGELATKRSELITLQNSLEQQQELLNSWLDSASQQLNSMLVQLPPPLVDSWQAKGNLTDNNLSGSERLQLILDSIAALADFQQRISLHQMAIKDDNGQEIWVKQLYLGASQAWFVSDDLSYVGVGYATPLGWQWQFDDKTSATEVAKAIAMLEKKQSADWIALPVRSYLSNDRESSL